MIKAALVKTILQHFECYEWTIQGFGFARVKIGDEGRIHVWDSSLTTPQVSTMHTHPWDFYSTIISGELVNCRFSERTNGTPLHYRKSRIATGEGGGLISEPESVNLYMQPPESYTSGEVYTQTNTEIHRTIAQDGTVTLIERPQGPPLEEAFVYWPEGTSWVSAEPVKADWRLNMVIARALARWDAR